MNDYKKIKSKSSADRKRRETLRILDEDREHKKLRYNKVSYKKSDTPNPLDAHDSKLYAPSSSVLPSTSFCERVTEPQVTLTSQSLVKGTSTVITRAMSPSAVGTLAKDTLSPIIYKSSSAETLPEESSSSHLSTKNDKSYPIFKRKRTVSLSYEQNEPDFESVPQSAKRKRMLPSTHESDENSILFPTYTSQAVVSGADTDSCSSDCLSNASDGDVGDAISESSNSEPEDRSIEVSDVSSPCSSSEANSHHSYEASTTNLGERTPCQSYCGCKLINTVNEQPMLNTLDDLMVPHYSCMTPAAEAELPRQCPLPALSWANADDVWQLMCKKDEEAACLRTASMLERHPSLQPRMRAILLDWLIEVCEVYKLHRETYYLALDYLDRYLSAQKNVQKTHLQLIGITCLFVAAKVEEIYPPKIGEFAYVTDGACQESDILQQEVLLLQALQWRINPVTPIGWLGVFMQLNVNNRTPASLAYNANKVKSVDSEGQASGDTYNSKNDFIYPQFSSMEFVQTSQLLDLCSLDVRIADYSYSLIAAAAMSHTFSRETALRCSGFDWQAVEPCARWMVPFFAVIREESKYLHLSEQNDQVANNYGLGRICPNVLTDDSHIIQTHTTTMHMFNRTLLMEEQHQLAAKIKQEASPAAGILCSDGPLTPPASSRKPVVPDDAVFGDVHIDKVTNKDSTIKVNCENNQVSKDGPLS